MCEFVSSFSILDGDFPFTGTNVSLPTLVSLLNKWKISGFTVFFFFYQIFSASFIVACFRFSGVFPLSIVIFTVLNLILCQFQIVYGFLFMINFAVLFHFSCVSIVESFYICLQLFTIITFAFTIEITFEIGKFWDYWLFTDTHFILLILLIIIIR